MTQSTIHRRVTLVLQSILCLELGVALFNAQWLTALVAGGIILVTLFPLLFRRAFQVYIPPQFQLLAIGFVFASLFLGEMRDYYTRFWWWDVALHATSGVLLGIVGFLLVHLLNETDDVGVQMKPGFVAFFAFCFAVMVGALWEIFEFTMDSMLGMNMQKPMLGDPSGLTDTMWDLIVDSLGALVISIYGWRYLRKGDRGSWLEGWIDAFIDGNPRLFGRGAQARHQREQDQRPS